MSYETVREYIETQLKALEGISEGRGKVLDYGAWTIDPDLFKAMFVAEIDSRIHAWTITRNAVIDAIEGEGSVPFFRATHTVILEGFMSMSDGGENSEADFQQVIENIRQLFRLDYRLGLPNQPIALVPVTLEFTAIDVQRFSNYLVHHGVGELKVQEREQDQGEQ